MGNMKMQTQKAARGFTLLELMVSMAVGLIAMAAMAMLFKSGMNATMMVTQRIDTQENMRAGMDLMVKDISLAGAGLPSGGIQLPYGVGNNGISKYACDQTGTCHVPNNTYPTGPTFSNYMYGIIPGYQDGVENNAVIPAAPAPAFSDSITVVYCDLNFPLWQYNVNFVAGTKGGQATLTPQAGYTPPSITSNGGLNQGDIIMISGGSTTAVGEITTYSASSGSPGATGSLTFANADPLNINQSGAASGNLNALATSLAGGAGVAYRLFVITYYLTVPAAGQTPRLMRQVNGLTPAPVADDIINLQFAFDNFNSATGALDANQPNPLGSAESPNNIQKVNIFMMGESTINNQKNSQNLYLATDVSASNMAYRDPY